MHCFTALDLQGKKLAGVAESLYKHWKRSSDHDGECPSRGTIKRILREGMAFDDTSLTP
jgi:hypothetical protein